MDLRRIRQIRFEINALTEELDRELAMREAITLAYTERTGAAAPEQFTYTEADEVRAKEIMLLFPKEGA